MSIETLIDHLEKCIQEEISFCGTPERENELQKILVGVNSPCEISCEVMN